MKPREYYEEHPEVKGKRRSYVSRAISLLSDGIRVLDAGAGGGGAASLIARSLGARVYCVDIARRNVESCRSMGFPAYQLDLENDPLPFPDAFFHAVILLEVVEHLFDPYYALSEIHRVLKPDGELVISTHNALNVMQRVRFAFGRVNSTLDVTDEKMAPHLRLYSNTILKRLLSKCGFTICRDASYFRLPFGPKSVSPPILGGLLGQFILLKAKPRAG
jgi:SAM-dependent methyltransferase